MTVPAASTVTSIDKLADAVRVVIDRAGAAAPARLDLWYLRRKPKRGLMAIYAMSGDGPPLGCLRVAESAMAGAALRWGLDSLARADLAGTWPGVLQLPAMGITLQAYPHDADLRTLAEVAAVDTGGTAFSAVRDALRDALGDPGFEPQWVSSTPMRYKPSDRCVMRFTAHPGLETVVGKVYADPATAASVHARTTELYDSQRAQVRTAALGRPLGPPLLPRPLAHVDRLGLILAEDVRNIAGEADASVLDAAKVVHPRGPMARSLDAISVIAIGLARLHAYPVSPSWPARTATAEAERVVRRAAQLAAYAPGHAERALSLGERVAGRLEAAAAVPPRASHGSFKPAQLLFRGDRLFITDFDQLGAADPALDVGYFLAYLRPPSLWYHRVGARRWFDELQDEFLRTYAAALTDLGGDGEDAAAVTARSRVYSAALMFKIANRRPNRLNSLRSAELEAMLAEIDGCLDPGSAPRC